MRSPVSFLMGIIASWVVVSCSSFSSSSRGSSWSRHADPGGSGQEISQIPWTFEIPVQFHYPIRDPQISSHFGWRGRRVHEGIDFRAATGTRIYASADGTVVMAGKKVRGYGRLIVLDHGQGLSSLYAHLSASKVRVGQKVRQGQLIGLAGRTGRATASHLHFEIRRGADPLDPLPLLERTEALARNP